MYLTGDNALEPITYAVTTLKSTLETAFASSPWLAKFAGVGGIQVTDDALTATQYLQSKRPHIFLEPGQCSEDTRINFKRVVGGIVKPGARWNIQINLDIVIPVYSARAEIDAIAAVKDIVKRNYETLRDLGLEASDISATDPDDAGQDRICPHTFRCNTHLIY